MASIINGYEHDIFISYRLADNKYDNWVSQFVSNLKKELEATFKERLSIYIDENPIDGLLETHNIEMSLTNKINSLIFIPVISQTYCDQNCYAWQHEFLAFSKLSKEDSYTQNITLRNGNVACRILPIKIHDLDSEDLKMLENELGGPMRAIDFVYAEPGVNRPLQPDDSQERNVSKNKYRNQVNKVANSIKEILISMQNPGKILISSPGEIVQVNDTITKSIAVLPFVNMSNDPEQEYFSDGISEEITNTLVQIRGLKVAGRSSAFSFKNKNEDLRVIGEKLNVKTILEGSVRKSGNRIRITAQIIEASSGFHLWSQKYDRDLNDVFNIQDEIARAIVNELQITLEGKPAEPKERPHTPNVEAYQLYLKGMALFYKRGLHMFEGLKCFEDALKIDPDYALSLSGLADSYTMLCLHSYMPPEEAWPKAAAAANYAVRIAPELAEAHSSMATISVLFERDWARGEKEYLRSLELNPHNIQALCWYSIFYLKLVKSDLKGSLLQAHAAAEYDPLNSYVQTIVSINSSDLGLFNEGIVAGRKAVECDKDSFSAWFFNGYSNYIAGNYAEAIEAYKQALGISGRHNWALASLVALYKEPSLYKNDLEADFIYREMLTKEKMGYVSPFLLAIASAALGKNEEALRYAKLGLDRHDPNIATTYPTRIDAKPLFAIPEFLKMMKETGLY